MSMVGDGVDGRWRKSRQRVRLSILGLARPIRSHALGRLQPGPLRMSHSLLRRVSTAL
jgi:hypothetical protein